METRREDFGERNVRFLGYNFLRNVTFNGEPVVPVIISEEKDAEGMYFNVEQLGGIDLDVFMDLPDIKVSEKEKLEVFDHVIQQLEVIDASGLIIFDRQGRNIRVLSWGNKGISTRQMDVEDFFDKRSNAVYDHRGDIPGFLEKYVDGQKKLGQSPWAYDVRNLEFLLSTYLSDRAKNGVDLDKYSSLRDIFRVYRNPLAKKPLETIHQDVKKMLANVS